MTRIIEHIDLYKGEEYNAVDVELIGFPHWEKVFECGEETGGVYIDVADEILWDEARFSEEENAQIEEWIVTHLNRIEKAFIEEFKKNYEAVDH